MKKILLFSLAPLLILGLLNINSTLAQTDTVQNDQPTQISEEAKDRISELSGYVNAARIALFDLREGRAASFTINGTVYETEEALQDFIDTNNAEIERLDSGGTVNSAQTGVLPTPNSGRAVAQFNYQGPTFDGPGLRGGSNIVAGRLDNSISKERDLKRLIIGWTNFITSVVALLAVVALVWAGTLYVTAFGDDSRMESAKKIVIWVVIGIILILGAYAIVNTVMQAVFA